MDVVQKRKHQPIKNTVNMQLNCLIGGMRVTRNGYLPEREIQTGVGPVPPKLKFLSQFLINLLIS